METYILIGGAAHCPKCSSPRFTGPSQLNIGDEVTCANCGEVCTVKGAIEAGREAKAAAKGDKP